MRKYVPSRWLVPPPLLPTVVHGLGPYFPPILKCCLTSFLTFFLLKYSGCPHGVHIFVKIVKKPSRIHQTKKKGGRKYGPSPKTIVRRGECGGEDLIFWFRIFARSCCRRMCTYESSFKTAWILLFLAFSYINAWMCNKKMRYRHISSWWHKYPPYP